MQAIATHFALQFINNASFSKQTESIKSILLQPISQGIEYYRRQFTSAEKKTNLLSALQQAVQRRTDNFLRTCILPNFSNISMNDAL